MLALEALFEKGRVTLSGWLEIVRPGNETVIRLQSRNIHLQNTISHVFMALHMVA